MMTTQTTKTCKRCGAVKPLDGFYLMASCPGGYRPTCRACCNVDQREKHTKPEVKAKRLAATRTWTAANAERSRLSHENSRLKRAYGISLEDYTAMLLKQGGVCAICEGACTSGRLSVDHCHNTGRVRGLLCRTCNTAIGLLDDSPTLVAVALKYLGGV